MDELKNLLKNHNFQEQLIMDINEEVDIPILNEKQETSLITFLVDSLVNIIDIIELKNTKEPEVNPESCACGNLYIEKQAKKKQLKRVVK